MWEKIKTGVLVTVVGALIWVFAEGESVRTETIPVAIVFKDDEASQRIVRVAADQNWRDTVQVVAEGSTAALSAVSSALLRPVVFTAGREWPIEPGEHVIDLRETLRSSAALRRSGITITEVKPATLKVMVDQLEARQAKVVVELSGAEIVGPPEPAPASVALVFPKRLAERVGPDPRVVARIDPSAVSRLSEGQRAVVPRVRLELPLGLQGAESVSLEPPTVDVGLTLQSRTDSVVLPSVPVQVQIPPGEYGKWEVSIPESSQFLKDVRVSGPREMIAGVREGVVRVIAVVPLTFEDLEGRITGKDAVFSELPTPLRFTVQDRLVKLQISPRGPAAGGGGGAGGAGGGGNGGGPGNGGGGGGG